jgi:hypothetical protein
MTVRYRIELHFDSEHYPLFDPEAGDVDTTAASLLEWAREEFPHLEVSNFRIWAIANTRHGAVVKRSLTLARELGRRLLG